MMASHRARWAARLKELRSLSVPARLALVAVLALAVVGAAWLAAHKTLPQRVWLFETKRFDPKQLEAMQAAFASAGLTDFAIKSGRIEVPKDQSARYLAALAQQPDLPYRFFEEVLNQRHWFTAQGDLDRQWDLAAQQFLAGIIREMEGVDRAWVTWDTAAKRGFRQRDDVRALVGVKMLPGYALGPRDRAVIHDLVVASRAGLTPEKVTVVDLSESADGRTAASVSSRDQLQQVIQLEQHYREKIERLLAFIDGVVVSVDLTVPSPHSSRPQAESEPAPPGGSERFAERETAPRTADVPDRDATQPAAPDRTAALAIVASQGPVMLREPSVTPAAPDEPHQDHLDAASSVPARIAVTIGVPDEYFARRTPGSGIATGKVLESDNEQIRRLVVAALPALPERVVVAVHRYRKRPAIAESGVAAWIDFGGLGGVQMAAAIVLLSAALLMLVVRSAMLAARMRRIEADANGTGGSPVPDPHAEQLRGQVQSMVHRDAVRTAHLLQSWIHQEKQ